MLGENRHTIELGASGTALQRKPAVEALTRRTGWGSGWVVVVMMGGRKGAWVGGWVGGSVVTENGKPKKRFRSI